MSCFMCVSYNISGYFWLTFFINQLIVSFMGIELNKVIKEHPNLIIQMTAGDLMDFAKELLLGEKAIALSMAEELNARDRLITVEEAAKMLHVSKMTLYRWDKVGYLKKVLVGGKRFYRKNDIEELYDSRLDRLL